MQPRMRRGQYAIIMAVGLVPLLGLGAVSIDLSRASVLASEADLLAYAAAQTAIVAYSEGMSTAEAEIVADDLVRSRASLDGQTFTLTDVDWGYVDRANGTLVTAADIEAAKATVQRTGANGLGTLFGSFFGMTRVDIGSHAISDTLPSNFDRDDCDTQIGFAGSSGAITRSNYDAAIDVPLEDLQVSGWYAVYKNEVAESGSSQRNESSYYRVYNAANPMGLPRDPNCGGEYIVPDYDNDGRTPERVYLGTFYFDASSANTIQMRHYCAIREVCPSFEDDQQACGASSDSIHINRGDANLCLEAL